MSWEKLAEALRHANHVYLCGNGGSAANALHLANDWVACGIKAHPLVADISTLTAIANDYGYEYVFSRQLDVFGQPGDVLVVLSGSGESRNILNAIHAAHEKQMTVWAMVGRGLAALIADHLLITDGTMQEKEQEQLKLGHAVTDHLKARLASVRG